MILNFHLKEFDTSISPIIFGVLNITPDSFSDGGKFLEKESAIQHGLHLLSEGAHVLDIGAESSRPGSDYVPPEIQLERLIPVIEGILNNEPTALISVDTTNSFVAKTCIQHGAKIINDISAGRFDPDMISVISDYQLPYLIMHMKGTPKTMQENPIYKNVTQEIIEFFHERISRLHSQGISNILIDPGFGFGKTTDQNYQLLAELEKLQLFNLPILVGVSRKRMIGDILQHEPKERILGSKIIETIALLNGCHCLRVHDVKETVDMIKLVKKYQQFSVLTT